MSLQREFPIQVEPPEVSLVNDSLPLLQSGWPSRPFRPQVDERYANVRRPQQYWVSLFHKMALRLSAEYWRVALLQQSMFRQKGPTNPLEPDRRKRNCDSNSLPLSGIMDRLGMFPGEFI